MMRAREVSSREVVTACLARIDALNPTFNAIISRRPDDEVLAEADAADRALDAGDEVGPLHGLPHAIKDTTNTAGLRSTYGSPALRGPDPDGGRARRHAGSPMRGRSSSGRRTSPSSVSARTPTDPIFGATGNPWNPGFARAAPAGALPWRSRSGCCPIADGSDLGGSLRNPAGWNNVFAPAPVAGPRAFVAPQPTRSSRSWSRRVRSREAPRTSPCCSGCRAVRTYGRRSRCRAHPAGRHAPLEVDLPPVHRIAWLADFGGHLPMELGVLSVCEAALKVIADAGLQVDAITPTFDWTRLWRCFVVLRQFSLGGDLAGAFADPAVRELMKPELQWELSGALELSVVDVQRAVVTRTSWYDEVLALFEEFDYLALPSAQVFPFPDRGHVADDRCPPRDGRPPLDGGRGARHAVGLPSDERPGRLRRRARPPDGVADHRHATRRPLVAEARPIVGAVRSVGGAPSPRSTREADVVHCRTRCHLCLLSRTTRASGRDRHRVVRVVLLQLLRPRC